MSDCNITQQHLTKSLVILWKNIQDQFVAKSDLPASSQPIIVVKSKEDITSYQKNTLYIVDGVGYFWDANELKPLTDSKIQEILSNIQQVKQELIQHVADEIEAVLGTLDSNEFIDSILNKFPKASAETAGLMTSEDKLKLEETRARLLDHVDREDVNRWFGDILSIE